MQCSREIEEMVCVAKGPKHGPAPIPEEGKWVESKQITDISVYPWCGLVCSAAGCVQAFPQC